MSFIVPAVLPLAREEFENKLAVLVQIPEISRIQIDVVDGEFASPASWPGPDDLRHMIAAGGQLPELQAVSYEIDIMGLAVERIVGDWLSLGASRFTVHAESSPSLPGLLEALKRQYGSDDGFVSPLISFGVALDLTTNIALIEDCLDKIEYVQFMGIAQIGRQGEPFDERAYEHVRSFRAWHPEIPVQVDGGITVENAKRLLSLGVSNLIVGSGISRAADPRAAFMEFESIENSYGI